MSDLNLWQNLSVCAQNTVISFEARPLKRGVVCQIMPYLKPDGDFNDSLNVIDKIANVLPEYIRNIKGLQIDECEITPEEMAEEGIFFEVLSLIVAELVRISSFSTFQAKN